MNALLRSLFSEELETLCATVSTAEALYGALKGRRELFDVRALIANGLITPDSIEALSKEVTENFKRGERLSHEEVLGMLAISLASFGTSFADVFIRDLAALDITEMPMAPRLARLALADRERVLGGFTVKTLHLQDPDTTPPTDEIRSRMVSTATESLADFRKAA